MTMPSTPSPTALATQAPDVASGLTELPERDLERGELRTLANAIADRGDVWRKHVAFRDEERHYVCLHRDAHVELWMLCWTPVNDTGWHDHDTSSGAVRVVQGTLLERNLAVGPAAVGRRVEAGDVFDFGPDHIHRLSGIAPGSISIHAYSPPLWRLGQYSVGQSGVLRRMSVSYAEELRPIEETTAR